MSSEIKPNLKYTKDHEWAEIKGDIVAIGITDFAQSALGDIVFLEIPAIGKELVQGSTFGVVESIKSVSDLYAPLSGEVIERNDSLESHPEKLNNDPFGSWLIKVKIKNESELKNLLSAADYQTHCSSSN
jgi:glycine cleavage system H protein